MAPEQVVEATILGVQPDGSSGWVKISTDQGELTTKWPEPIAEAQAHIGQRVSIAYEMGEAKQSQRTGQWFPAPRYFKRVVQGYQQPPQFAGQQAQAPQPQMAQQPVIQQPVIQPPQPQYDDGGERGMRIMRQTAAKCAVWTMQLVPSEQRTFQNQLAVAEAWMRYFIGGIQGTGMNISPQAPTQEQQMAAMGGLGPQDDIPF